CVSSVYLSKPIEGFGGIVEAPRLSWSRSDGTRTFCILVVRLLGYECAPARRTARVLSKMIALRRRGPNARPVGGRRGRCASAAQAIRVVRFASTPFNTSYGTGFTR